MSLDQQTVTEALKQVIDPNTGKDFVAGRSIRNLAVEGGTVRFDVELGYPAKSQHEPIRALLAEAVSKLAGVERVEVKVTSKVVAHAVQQAAHAAQPQPAAKALGAVDPGKCFGIIHR